MKVARCATPAFAVLELLVELPECGDFGGTNEREIFRPEEEDLPLTLVVLVGNGFECVVFIGTDGCSKTKIRELLSYT
jgi:hypothetical protein